MQQPMNLGGFPEEMHNFMFRSSELTGMDLIAMDIQRGRDHGLPPYIDIVKHCTNFVINDFNDLAESGSISIEVSNRFVTFFAGTMFSKPFT